MSTNGSVMMSVKVLSISRDISDAYSVPLHNSPRIYLYDDFLGRTSITEKLEKNEDHRLVSLIERIKDSPRERLILTTREYILHQAQNVYERLNTPIFDKPQCIVDLSSYTRSLSENSRFQKIRPLKIEAG